MKNVERIFGCDTAEPESSKVWNFWRQRTTVDPPSFATPKPTKNAGRPAASSRSRALARRARARLTAWAPCAGHHFQAIAKNDALMIGG